MTGWRGALYAFLRSSNDARAVRRGRVPQRLGRRVLGRASGRAIGRLFK